MDKEKELAKNTIILTFGKICTQFVSFLLLPLYTALLVPEQFGIVDLINTYVLLLVPLFNWQFENGLFRFMLDHRGDEEQQSILFSNVIFTNVVQSILYLIFYCLVQGFISTEFKIFLAIDVVLNIFQNTLLQFPRGLGKNSIYAFGSFLSATVAVIMNVVLIAFCNMGALGMFVATVVAKTITICYLAAATRAYKYIRISNVNKNEISKIARYSLPLVPNQLAWWVIGASDRTVLSHFVSVAANGIYAVANKFSSIYVTFYNIFNMSWTESVSIHLEDEDRDEFLTSVINSMFTLFTAAGLGIIACMPFAFPVLLNSKYNEAYNQIPILMIAIIFQIVVGLYSVIYVAKKKSAEIAKTSFFAAVINIMVDLLLVSHIKIYAASISTLAAYVVMAFYRYFHVKKYVSIKLKPSAIIMAMVVGTVILIPYYSHFFIGQIVALCVAICYAVIGNKSFICSTLGTIRSFVRTLRHR